MVESERQAIQCLRKCLCASGIDTLREFLKQGNGLPNRQNVKRNLLGPAPPLGKARSDENFCPSRRQQVANFFWARNVVVDE
jgi:hypothetical protein